jgi:hypothetical protein
MPADPRLTKQDLARATDKFETSCRGRRSPDKPIVAARLSRATLFHSRAGRRLEK